MGNNVNRFVVCCVVGWCACSCAALTQPPKVAAQMVHGPAFNPAAKTGEIDGAVHTLSGAPLAAAEVEVLNADGSTRATLAADTSGHFRIQLPPGTYAVVVSRPGFLRLRIGNVIVTSGRTVPLNFSLAALPPSAVSGAILHLQSLAPAGASMPTERPAAAPPPPPPTGPKAIAPQQAEQVIQLHPESKSYSAASIAAPPKVSENPGESSADAQAKAAVAEEQQKQQEVQDFVNSLPKGLISYVVPLQMRLNQPVTVSVKIFGSHAPAALAAAAGGTAPAPVPTSNYMQVYLSQEDNPGAFAIEQNGDQNPRWVSSTSETDWNWTVTPKTTGTAKLRFQTLVMFPDQAGKLPATYDVKDETVTVTTPTMGDYLHGAWDAFLTNPAVWFEYILPGGTGFVVLAWLVNGLRKRKKKKGAG
ncbi:MAG TPA: carboxypeptidase-like regulatory domain-containing protein [Acidobacteriaceae bacterium]